MLRVPIRQQRITAIVYHGIGASGVVPLQPAGHQINAGFLSRISDRLFGSSSTPGPRYYVNGDDAGPDTGSVDVGAPAGTTVWSPVDGVVAAIRPYELDGHVYGTVVQIRPDSAPAVTITLHALQPLKDSPVQVGDQVTAARTALGTIVDLSNVLDQTVAQYTSDAGNHVAVSLGPSRRRQPDSLARRRVRILFIADIFAAPGRRIVEERLPGLREQLGLDLVVANGENAADGVGITSRIAKRLLGSGVDAITLGNHAHRQREVYPYLGIEPRIIRPANMPAASPGRGETTVHTAAGGRRHGDQPAGPAAPRAGRQPVRDGARPGRGRPGPDARGAGRLPRRGDQREGRDGPAAGRRRHRGRRHPHARPDQRRDRAARRHRLPDRRRHDRPARLGDRRAQRSDHPAVPHRSLGAVRAGRRATSASRAR